MSVVNELRALYERDGELTPEQVLDVASDPTSSLHNHFTWDDTEAAQKWRLNQARTLIMRCKVTVIGSDEQTHRVRAFVNLPAPEGPGAYVSIEDALGDPAKRDVVIQQAMRDVAALRRKYRALADFDAILHASIDSGERAAS